MFKTLFYPALISLIFTRCHSLPKLESQTITDEDKVYIKSIEAYSESILIGTSEEKVVWSRAHNFVNKYSDLEIKVATDYKIATHSAETLRGNKYAGIAAFSGTIPYSYNVFKELIESDNKLKISVTCSSLATTNACKTNNMIFLKYLATGDIRPKFLNKDVYNFKDPETSKRKSKLDRRI